MSELVAPVLDAPPLHRYGFPELVYGTSPAAAADFVQAIGGGFYVRLVSVFARLVTDANAGDRELVLEYRDGDDNRYALFGAPVEVTASSTNDYAFSAFQPRAEWPVDSSIIIPLGPQLLLPTHDFRLHIVGAQAGDQISRVRYVQECFYTD